jgi:hypothetical protein
MHITSTRLRGALAVLLVVAAALFAIGSTLERQHHAERRIETSAAATGHETSGESSGESSAQSSRESLGRPTGAGGSGTAEHRRASGEAATSLLGVNTESIGLEVAAIVASLAFALAVWLLRSRLVLVALVVFGGVFAAADARELAHQLNESRPGLSALAVTLIVLHLTTIGLAAALFTHRQDQEAAAAAP